MKLSKILFLAILVILATSCGSDRVKVSNPDSFRNVISLHSYQDLSIGDEIMIQFVDEIVEEAQSASNSIIDISPNVKGELNWTEKNTLRFTPHEPLASDQAYEIDVNLDKIISNLPDSLSKYTFEVKTRKRVTEFGQLFLNPIGDSLYNMSGSIMTTDLFSDDELKERMSVLVKGEKPKIIWSTNTVEDSQYRYFFDISSLKRDKSKKILEFEFKDNDKAITERLNIPRLGTFRLLDSEVSQGQKQQIKLIFSDFIKSNQIIDGLVTTSSGNPRLTIRENFILLDFNQYLSGDIDINISEELLNEKGYKLEDDQEVTATIEATKPGVRVYDSKTIIPYGETLPFAFESVNLEAVDVKVTKLATKNVFYFLKDNAISSNYRFNYLGEVVLKKKIKITTQQDIHLWNRQVIDLSSLINKDPSAIYHVEIGFRKSYSVYPCTEDFADDLADPSTINVSYEEKVTKENFWDLRDKWNSRYDYDYSQRDNPCHSYYYRRSSSNRSISTNILGSNLGVMAKQEKDNDLFVAITNLKTTEPMTGIEVSVYNKTNRKLGTSYTNGSGTAKFSNIEKGFLVVASTGRQKGYLKINPGNSLSMSRFDVDGTAMRQDIKGFLYGERGVWRPGDSIYINLVVEDKHNELPSDYPIGFEFINPKGQVVHRHTTTEGVNGHYTFWTKTGVSDVTGRYLVKAYVGDNTFTKSVKVETIRPNRLKFNINCADDNDLYVDEPHRVKIETKWLHGAPGSGMRHTIEAEFTQREVSFKGHESYDFIAPYRGFAKTKMEYVDSQSNENGIVEFEKTLTEYTSAPSALNVLFNFKVFEKGGRFSVDNFRKTYYPHKEYVGLKVEGNNTYVPFDVPVNMDLVNLTNKGKIANDDLKVKVYEVQYDWWYDLSKNSEYKLHGKFNNMPFKSDTVKTVNGKAQYKLLISNSSKARRYLVLVENSEGHVTGTTLTYHERNSYSQGYDDDYEEQSSSLGTKKLRLQADKEAYQVGDKVTLNIPTVKAGKILVSIEDGQEILSTEWLNVNGSSTKYEFYTDRSMAPYVYANVLYIQPYDHSDNDLPLRMYGVIPIKVESKHSELRPIIAMQDELRPETQYSVNITEAKGQPMTYTLAVVDEGLLNITNYKHPDIWSHFNGKPSLEIKTWDVFDDVRDAEKFKTRNLLSLGGDGSGNAPADGIKLNRFKPVVKFIGPFYLPAGGAKNHTLEMPNYIGEVRVMVMAAQPEYRSYGKVSKHVQVKNPLMVLGTLPRVLSPGEELDMPIDVFAMKEHIKNVDVRIEANDMIELLESPQKAMSFDKVGNQQVAYRLKVKDKFGVAKVKVFATSGNEVSTYEVELEIRLPNSNRVKSETKVVAPNSKLDQVYAAYGYKGTNDISLEVSSIPAINLKKRLDYLIRYPYGCLEQTTSSVFPQLYLNSLTDLSAMQKREIERNVQEGIDRIKRYGHSSGGFSYWPGGNSTHDWASNYAGNFLLEAQKKGFRVDNDLLDRWTTYLKNTAKGYSSSNGSDITQAYRLYLLAKVGSPEKGAMNRLRLELREGTVASWYLAGAYSKIGKTKIAEELYRNAQKKFDVSSRGYDYYYQSFGSAFRNKAIAIQMLLDMNKKNEAWTMAKELAKELNNDTHYLSTQETSFGLMTMARIVESNKGKAMNFTVSMGEKENVFTEKAIWQKTLDFEKNQQIEVINNANIPLFVSVIQNGVPTTDDTENISEGLTMGVQYTNREGQEISADQLQQGEDLIAEVTVVNTTDKYLRHLALTQKFPSGWEIQNPRMDNSITWRNSSSFEDIRDDRVDIFFNIGKEEEKVFKVFLNATYEGQYYLPAVEVEDMYNHEYRARKHGRWIKVVK